jgi:IPT/TIG domain
MGGPSIVDASPVRRGSIQLGLVAAGALTVLAVGVVSGTAPVTAQASPTLTAISPNSGPEAGGSDVTLTGTNLDPDASITTVTFGSNEAPSVDCSDDTTCVVEAPPGTGTVDVVISNANGTSNVLPFTYIPPLAFTDAQPRSGPSSGGARMTFTGISFSTAPGGTQFFVEGLAFTNVTCESTTTCTGVSPPCDAGESGGPWQVTVDGVDAFLGRGGGVFTCTQAGSGIGSSDGGGDLAGTGASATTLALLAAVMFGASGWSLVLAARRRSDHQ